MVKRTSFSRLFAVFASERSRIEATVRIRAGEVAAADVMQDAWIKLAQQSEAGIEQPSAFVRSVARNAATDHRRKERRRASLDAEVQELLWETEDAVSPERILIGRQAVALMRQAIDDLPPQTKRIFEMNRFDGLTFREIAAELGISEPAVYYHIRRALERLAMLREHLPD
ncbi:RNA polymerase sigma factor [Enterovirga rhinocerotis]|uniref:RNA polymerase sigma-70 factor (ECF subfamily) n=1 Tax=Enterovirga rhinocerotis TaxID=1339210 RepID=A0A4R7BGX6_9HYPH|nr:sigma-70 family RNA polymerase sigma factor [Enterovirga rhinocerotis]TDR84524.1 RNA polymerase sigma-70 factor (ECF subfamily) [Enterovirga rhinocerotis]